MSHVTHNFIVANYGASQGFDTDDGSSWYNISANFMFEADGWKMDYGGHDSIISHNVFYHSVAGNDGQNCLNAWPFLPDHGASYTHNKCILPESTVLFGMISSCDCPGNASFGQHWHSTADPDPESECGVTFGSNQYFTPNGTATTKQCGDFATKWMPANEPDSTVGLVPGDDQLITWAKDVLNLR